MFSSPKNNESETNLMFAVVNKLWILGQKSETTKDPKNSQKFLFLKSICGRDLEMNDLFPNLVLDDQVNFLLSMLPIFEDSSLLVVHQMFDCWGEEERIE